MNVKQVSIIFLCVGNACRSQMAEAFARYFSAREFGNFFVPYSAGTFPASYIPEEVFTIMAEENITLQGQFPKLISALPIKEADVVVTMGCEVECPAFPHKQLVEWDIPDPINSSLSFYRRVRDVIKSQVYDLLKSLYPGKVIRS
ncbi:arsenate reductase ArsC [Candidatus Sumerlaeota bacterium]|nr:arsenate reductase ArsC [Candidatus Sumerlaeota bacterium]